WPIGGGSTVRGMWRWMSHTSTLIIGQMTMRAESGNWSGGRSMMAEYARRSFGVGAMEIIMDESAEVAELTAGLSVVGYPREWSNTTMFGGARPCALSDLPHFQSFSFGDPAAFIRAWFGKQ